MTNADERYTQRYMKILNAYLRRNEISNMEMKFTY